MSRFPSVHDAVSDPQGGDITPDEHAYLRAIADTPTITATERDRRLGVPTSTGHLRRRVLEAKGYLRLLPVRTGRRGGAAVLTALTHRAMQLLDRPAAGQSRQDDALLRAYYGEQLAAWAAGRGWQAEIRSDDGVVDVRIRRPSGRIAIMIILSGDDAARAARWAADAAADAVYLVAPDLGAIRRAARQARHLLPPAAATRVRFTPLARLLAAGIPEESLRDGAPAAPGWGSPSDGASPRSAPYPADGNRTPRRVPSPGGRRPRRPELHALLTLALRHLDDAFALDHLPLADLPAAAPYVRRYAGRTAARGRGVQHLLRDAVERITEARPQRAFERFARAYVAGASVAAAARHAGVSREHASRVFRPRLVDHLVIELRAMACGDETMPRP
jgi:hypothetical protein